MTRAGTITALATAPGRAGVAIVRVSGDAAFAIAETIARQQPQVGRILYARFYRPDPADRELLDAGLLLAFAAPHSYTWWSSTATAARSRRAACWRRASRAAHGSRAAASSRNARS